MKFLKSKKSHLITENINFKDKPLKFINEIKYLGFYLRSDLSNDSDILNNRNLFYKNFNTIVRKFSNTKIDVILSLFKSYCMQFYGSNLWINGSFKAGCFKSFEIGYHKAIKKMLNVPWGVSNHDACEALQLLTFKNFIHANQIKFIFRIFNSSNKPNCFIDKCSMFLKRHSAFLNNIVNIFKDFYNIDNIFSNDLDALLSRIFYVQKHEPRSSYMSL